MKRIFMFVISIAVLFICINSTAVYALDVKGTDASGGAEKSTSTKDDTKTDWRDGFKYADEFTNGEIEWDEDVKSNPSVSDMEEKIKQDFSSIFSFLLAVGTSLTVIIGAVLGIKFMMASAEDKAKIKEQMIPYIIGTAVIYGAFTIWYITVQVFEKLG